MFIKSLIRFLPFLSLILPVVASQKSTAQIYEPADTSYFLKWDDDLNLIMAADRNDIFSVNLLLKRGANVNAITFEGTTPLMYATQNGNLEMVKLLADSAADLNKKPLNGISALIEASIRNYYEIAEYLVQKGADLNITDRNGVSAVHYAAAFNNYDIMDMLIYYGADMELADSDGNTPIISAAYNNSFESVDLLLQNNADINSVDENGFSALMIAIQRGNYEIADMLVEKGADPDMTNKGGLSALSYAVVRQDLQLIKELVSTGANVNQLNSKGTSILEMALKTKNDSVISFLKNAGARGTSKPDFDKISFGPVLDFNLTDYMNGIHFSLLDSKYRLGINSGFVFRPAANRILADISGITYQFWERRYFFYIGLEKRFKIIDTRNFLESGPYFGVNELLTFGGYRGSTQNPDTRLITSPFIGWYFNKPFFGIRGGYEYLDFKTPELNGNRITVTFTLNIQRMKQKLVNKKISWLD